jgi:hypothetical protein
MPMCSGADPSDLTKSVEADSAMASSALGMARRAKKSVVDGKVLGAFVRERVLI